ncbi:MAG: hypothetical protein NDI90_14890 [Nitrospira sp. BO4]|jgi:hypothetical protein|nr:hypothetical protein [Nitrospira sp. BO4]
MISRSSVEAAHGPGGSVDRALRWVVENQADTNLSELTLDELVFGVCGLEQRAKGLGEYSTVLQPFALSLAPTNLHRIFICYLQGLDSGNFDITKCAVDKLDWMDLVKGSLSGQLL